MCPPWAQGGEKFAEGGGVHFLKVGGGILQMGTQISDSSPDHPGGMPTQSPLKSENCLYLLVNVFEVKFFQKCLKYEYLWNFLSFFSF